MTELCVLGAKYKTDKIPALYHSYTPYYHELFKGCRYQVEKVLEIGIGDPDIMRHIGREGYVTGASLFMWRDYFPNAEIYGLDNKREILIFSDRIRSFYCDQGDRESLLDAIAEMNTNFDIIIDDGSHVPEHQALSLEMLYPLLNLGGIYVIEDVLHPEKIMAGRAGYCEIKSFSVDSLADDRLMIFRA